MSRIGMVLDNEFSNDPRVKNEVVSLQANGHQVFVLCYNFLDKKNEVWNGAQIIRINVNKFFIKKIKGLNNTIINVFPSFWKRHISKFISKYKIEKLHVHDLWMLDAAIRANKKSQLPLIVDLHENFVHAIKHYKYAKTFPGNILISHEKWKRDELKWLEKTDHIIVVIEEAKDRLIKMGVEENKIKVVPNYVNREDYKNGNPSLTEKLKEKYNNNYVMTYTGGFDIHRGLDIPIKALPSIIKSIPNFKFVLVGRGSNEEELKDLAKELNVFSYIEFTGFQPHGDLPSYVEASDICIIPHKKTAHTDNTIPHKLFQYMVMKRPIVASNCSPIKRILEATKAGMVYQHDDEEACADAIRNLVVYSQNDMGEKGYHAVENHYNWSVASRPLLELYS